MIRSMTGFATTSGKADGHEWTAELRGVNGKGLDLRLRLPEGLTHLDAGLRSLLSKQLARGSVTLSLKVTNTEQQLAFALNAKALDQALNALTEIERAAEQRGLVPSAWSAVDLLSVRGIYEPMTSQTEETAALDQALVDSVSALLDAFLETRVQEGAALDKILRRQLEEVSKLTAEAAILAEKRQPEVASSLRTNLNRVLETADKMDPNRIAQELALLAVKSDVTEEIDRLQAHIEAARSLLDADGPVGRKLDFLMQEFNREANTLCSKAQSKDLTAVGLSLKALIDQMREQVQNVE